LELSRNSGLSQNSLGLRLGLEKSTVSRLMGILEGRGWIERNRDRHDSRVIRLRLSPLGTRAARRLATTRQAKFAKVFDSIPREKRGEILESLSILTEVLRES